MPNPRLSIFSADGTVQTFDADNPLAVEVKPAGGGSDIDDADLLYATGTTAALGVTTLVAAPGAGVRIVVSSLMVQNESGTATTVQLRAGGATAMRALLQNQGNAFSYAGLIGREWKLPANTALNLNLDGANSHGYTVIYYTESTG
jgi:hypothetical protein